MGLLLSGFSGTHGVVAVPSKHRVRLEEVTGMEIQEYRGGARAGGGLRHTILVLIRSVGVCDVVVVVQTRLPPRVTCQGASSASDVDTIQG